MSRYERLRAELRASPRRWLVTGAAGFIGSNLLETLLELDQHVVGLDDFSTGYRLNLERVQALVGETRWKRFRFIEGTICELDTCREAAAGVDHVLHQAALGSVPRSIEQPLASWAANADGFVKMMTAARDAGVRSFVYASSSSVYGDSPVLPKVEDQIGQPLSPYAATKYVDEVFAGVYARSYKMRAVGLRYFNVFGPRQDPDGAYAAVIPKWIASLLRGDTVYVNGDGETSRDFCFIANTVQANLLSATVESLPQDHEVFNVACGDRTTLNTLFASIRESLMRRQPAIALAKPVYRDFRAGDVRHSLADIGKARSLLGYEPTHDVASGLEQAMNWYVANVR
jgi:UDP-N-acetylglucosamine 4-epimerase